MQTSTALFGAAIALLGMGCVADGPADAEDQDDLGTSAAPMSWIGPQPHGKGRIARAPEGVRLAPAGTTGAEQAAPP